MQNCVLSRPGLCYAEQLKPMLMQALLRGVSKGLGHYVGAGGDAALWTRTVRAGRNQFGSDSGLAGDLVAAVLAEMRGSGLVA
jgi:hypothetical protein